jgi:MFS family permease
MAEGPAAKTRNRLRVFKHPNYGPYLLAGTVVQIASGAQSAAIAYEVFRLTQDPQALAKVAGVLAIPMLLFTLPGGYLADRFNRLNVISLSYLGTSATSAMLAYAVWQGYPLSTVYALLFVDATFLSFGRASRQALLPTLVSRRLFTEAVTWRTSVGQISGIAGPALGGLLLTYGATTVFLTSAVLQLGGLLLLRLLKTRQTTVDETTEGPVKLLVEGARFLFRKKVILGAVTLDLFAVLLGGVTYIVPAFAEEILNVDEVKYGLLMAAPAAGAFLMAILLSLGPPIRHAGKTLLVSVALFGVATLVFAFSKSYWLSFAALLFTGVFDNVSVVIRHTLVQMLTPDHLRGRVSAVNSVFIGSSNEIGGVRAGATAGWFGIVPAAAIGAVGTLLVVGAVSVFSPRLRKFGDLASAGRK